MAIATSAGFNEPKHLTSRHHAIAMTLAFCVGPWLGFLYLGHGRLARQYLAYGLLVAALFMLLYLADLGFLASMPYEVFYVLLVHVAGTFHCANRERAACTRAQARFYRRLALALVLPTIALSAALYALGAHSTEQMRSPAMAPTIGVNSPFFINHLAYRWAPPARGDVVLYATPDKRGPIIRMSRIIGLPGDRIGMQMGVPRINGTLLPVRQLEDYVINEGPVRIRAPSFVETLPDGTQYRVLTAPRPGTGRFDNHPDRLVPAGAYFVMGDNRPASRDSRDREGIGFVRLEQIEGRVYSFP